MTKPEPDPKSSPARTKRWKTWFSALLALLVLGLVSHQPLLRLLITTLAPKIAAMRNIELSFELSGSILHDLELRNFKAKAIKPAPFQSLTFKSAKASYSLLELAFHGPEAFVKSCDIQEMEIVLDPQAQDPEKRNRPMHLSNLLKVIAHPPILPTDHGEVQNFRLIVHTPKGPFELLGASTLLDKSRPGFLSIERLHIPDVHTWENLSGTTIYENGTVLLRNVKLDPDVQINWARVAAPKDGKTSLTAEGHTFGGRTEVTLEMEKTGKDLYHARIHGQSHGGSLESLTRYFKGKVKGKALGRIQRLSVDLQGDPNSPVSWNGNANTQIETLELGQFPFGLVSADLKLGEGQLALRTKADNGSSHLALNAEMMLPETLGAFKTTPIRGNSSLTYSSLLPLLSGDFTALAQLTLENGVFRANLQARTDRLQSGPTSLGNADCTLSITKYLKKESASSSTDFFKGFQSQINARFSDLRSAGFASDSGTLAASSNEREIKVSKFLLQRGINSLRLQGHALLPLADAKSDFDLRCAISAPDLAAFQYEKTPYPVSGQVQGTAHLSSANGSYEGQIDLKVSNLNWQGFKTRSLELDAVAAHGLLEIKKANLLIDPNNQAQAGGSIRLQTPLSYSLNVHSALEDLSAFTPLLRAFGNQETLAGNLVFKWNGTAAPGAYAGDLALNLRSAQFGNLKISEASTSGTYSPQSATFPDLRVVSGKTRINGALEVLEGKLRLRSLSVQQADNAVLSGFIYLPFEPKNLGTKRELFPGTGGVAANINANNLNLGTLFASFGQPAPLEGSLTANLVAGGTLADPSATLRISANTLKSDRLPKLSPADLEAQFHYADKEFTVTAMARQAELQTLRLEGAIPFDLQRTLQTGEIDSSTPLDLRLAMPSSNAALLSKIVPIIRFSEGSMSGSFELKGTVASPQLKGGLRLKAPAIRFNNPQTPPLNNLSGELSFVKDRLLLKDFSSELGGGRVSAKGSVAFTTLWDPLLDLSLNSDDALILRNDTLTLRADSKLNLSGPLSKANLSGEVGLTRSRFFREIDLLPIQLPGRAAPRPPVQRTGFSLQKAPLRDWTFDVAIKSKDPFAVRGNLTNGSLLVDLKLLGTGLAPTLDGNLRFQDVSASLPFSRLDVASGYVYYTPEEPFVPKLDIRGTSELRNYNINVYIYGTGNEPVTLFTSEPPLPQEEIIALLATGSTSEELTSNPNAVAGRAAALLFQKIYRKFSKPAPQEPPKKQSLASRFQLEVGGVDPRTGLQELQTTFKLADHFEVVGDLDVQGNARGQLRYVLRFR